ncbi:MAG: glycosyltransferase family 39 protein, partial [Methanoregula sp.]|nr:glycosyltransferase family 39 protein [Methanoregula sp.]
MTPAPLSRAGDPETGICVALFLTALFVIIAVSSPALLMNDEWTTVNQVHQIDIGHQVATNEGKYGTFANGTPAPYFAHFNNILRYSVALPLASMPAMKAVDLFGSQFRLAVVLLWALLPFFIALVISRWFPEYAEVRKIRITLMGAGISLLLFAANLLLYTPFVYAASDAPVEVAAVVFTTHLFFALTVVMIYLIARRIFTDRWMAVFAALACTACSTYLLWGGTAKDHMATVAVFAFVLWFLVRYFQSRRYRDAACGFFSIGILTWIRPEVGLSAFVCLGLLFIMTTLLSVRKKEDTLRSGMKSISAILFTAVGAIPFFVNNLLISGNPLVPPLLLERKIRYGSTSVIIAPASPVASTGSHVVTTNPLIVSSDFAATLKTYLFSVSPNPPADLFGILFSPQNGSIGFFIIVPVALLGLVLLPFILRRKEGAECMVTKDRDIVALLLVAAFSVLIAYLYNLHNVNAGSGIWPDIRYLSPAYLTVTLLGLVVLRKTALLADPRRLVMNTCFMGILLAAVLGIVTLVLLPSAEVNVPGMYRFFGILVPVEVLVIAALTLILPEKGSMANLLSEYALPIMLLTVLTLQILILIV